MRNAQIQEKDFAGVSGQIGALPKGLARFGTLAEPLVGQPQVEEEPLAGFPLGGGGFQVREGLRRIVEAELLLALGEEIEAREGREDQEAQAGGGKK